MVTRVLNLMYREVRGLHQAAYILALFAFGSQMLALVRDRLLAHTFGAGVELDLYYAAFRVPDLLYVLFGSVLSVYVLLPFVSRANGGSEAGGRHILNQMFTLFLLAYTLMAVVLFVCAPFIIPLLFPGFAGESDTVVMLTRIMLLQPFLLGLSSLCGVVTQLGHRFILYAVSPLLYNLGIIVGAVALYPFFGLAGLALGVVLGALGHVAVQWPLVRRSQLRFGFVREFDWPLIRSVLTVALPRALTLSVHQISLLILASFASLMAAGSVSVFQFAFNLQSVPLAIVGMSYSVAAFPALAQLASNREMQAFTRHLMTSLRHIIFWSLPIIALVVVLRAQIVRVLLGTGAFDWGDTRLTAAVLAVLVVGLAAQAVQLLLVRAFYADGRTVVPFLLSALGLMVTVASALAAWSYFVANPEFQRGLETLLRLSGVPGTEVLVLALGYTTGALVMAGLLLSLAARTFALALRPLGRRLFEATTAAVAGGVSAYATLALVVDGVNQETFIGILLQGLAAGVMGVLAVGLVYRLLGSHELAEISRAFHAKIFKTDVIAPQPDNF